MTEKEILCLYACTLKKISETIEQICSSTNKLTEFADPDAKAEFDELLSIEVSQAQKLVLDMTALVASDEADNIESNVGIINVGEVVTPI